MFNIFIQIFLETICVILLFLQDCSPALKIIMIYVIFFLHTKYFSYFFPAGGGGNFSYFFAWAYENARVSFFRQKFWKHKASTICWKRISGAESDDRDKWQIDELTLRSFDNDVPAFVSRSQFKTEKTHSRIRAV